MKLEGTPKTKLEHWYYYLLRKKMIGNVWEGTPKAQTICDVLQIG
jgi:hypothetical protein